MQDEEKEEREEVSDEVWAKRAAARQRQIDIGKARREYECFSEAVPHNERCGYHPRTPDPQARISKRAFDRLLSTWRRQLHDFDIGDKTMMALTPATDSTRADSEAGASPPSANSTCMDNRHGPQSSNGEWREQEEVSRRLQLAALLPGPQAVGQPSGGPPRRSSIASSGANSSPPAPNAAVAMLSSMAMTPQQFTQAPAMGLHQWPSPVRLPSYPQSQANMIAMTSFVPTCPWTTQAAWAQPQSAPATHGSFWQQQQQQNLPTPLNTSHSSSSSIRCRSKDKHDESESKDRPKSPQSPKVRKEIDVKEPSTPPSKTQAQAFSSPVHKVHSNRSPSSSYGNTPSPQQTYGRQRMMSASVPHQQQVTPFAQTVCSSYRMPVPNGQVGTPATPVHRFTGFPYGPGSGSAGSMQPQCGSTHGGTPNGIAMCSPSQFVFQFERPSHNIVSPAPTVAPPLPFGSPLAQRQQSGSQGLTPGPKPPGLKPGLVLKQPPIDGSRNASVGDLNSYTANCAARFEMMEWRGSNSDIAFGRNDGVNPSCP